MKRIRNSLVTALVALLIAGGGMASSFFLLQQVERQVLKKETEENQEEIILTEEETDRLVMLLKALEEDNLTRIRTGNGANIPEEKAVNMMGNALSEMGGLRLEEYVPDIPYLFGEFMNTDRCELYADKNNRSMEVYKLTYLYQRDPDLSVEITGILDARSGLLISLNLAFLGKNEWERKIEAESDAAAWAREYENYSKEYNEEIYYTAEEIRAIYPLELLLDSAAQYYAMNTNFDFFMSEEEKAGADCYRLESQDGEYYIELTRDQENFHFQLHKFDL